MTRSMPHGRARGARARWSDDDGFAGGWEALPFGLLIFVVATLVVANAWAVVDAKAAVTAAAREGARAFVEAEVAETAQTAAVAAATQAIDAHNRDPVQAQVQVAGTFSRCQRVEVRVAYTVPAVVLPWVGGWGAGITARATHVEIVDPLRSGVPGEAGCVDA